MCFVSFELDRYSSQLGSVWTFVVGLGSFVTDAVVCEGTLFWVNSVGEVAVLKAAEKIRLNSGIG